MNQHYEIPVFLQQPSIETPEPPADLPRPPRTLEEVDARIVELSDHLAIYRIRQESLSREVTRLREQARLLEMRCEELDPIMQDIRRARNVLYQKRFQLRKTQYLKER
jgi:hypothetical protein